MGSRGVQKNLGEKRQKNKKPEKRSGAVCLGYYAATSKMQEVPVGEMVQGTPFRCLSWPTEVKPPKCPTRHPRVGG